MPGSSRGALQSPPRYPSTGTVLGALRMLHANRGARLARCPSAGGISRLKEKIKKKEGEKQIKSARCRSGRQVPAQRDGRGSLTVVAAVSPVVGHGAPPRRLGAPWLPQRRAGGGALRGFYRLPPTPCPSPRPEEGVGSAGGGGGRPGSGAERAGPL